jgi:hypothetical protein
MKELFKNWSIWRILRLIIGLIVINEAGVDDSFALYMVGGFIFLHALLNIGCSSAGCKTAPMEQTEKNIPGIKTKPLDMEKYKH